jgi:hypothetical protein
MDFQDKSSSLSGAEIRGYLTVSAQGPGVGEARKLGLCSRPLKEEDVREPEVLPARVVHRVFPLRPGLLTRDPKEMRLLAGVLEGAAVRLHHF